MIVSGIDRVDYAAEAFFFERLASAAISAIAATNGKATKGKLRPLEAVIYSE